MDYVWLTRLFKLNGRVQHPHEYKQLVCRHSELIAISIDEIGMFHSAASANLISIGH